MKPWQAQPAAPGAAPAAASGQQASDPQATDTSPHYCPTDLLASFALLMAGHGRCICTPMMLGDREYAMWQLTCAQAIEGDAELARVAKRLSAYFDDPEHSGMPVLGFA